MSGDWKLEMLYLTPYWLRALAGSEDAMSEKAWKVWVICGEFGTYNDRCFGICGVFASLAEADARMADLKREKDGLGERFAIIEMEVGALVEFEQPDWARMR